MCISHLDLFGYLQGHDGEKLLVGQWVAVAYDKTFYIGKILSLSNDQTIKIDFLSKRKDGAFKWPRPKDTDIVSSKYVFCSLVQVEQKGTDFLVNQFDRVEYKYKLYQKKYMV